MTGTLTYTQVGDYLIPDLALSEPVQTEQTEALGRYARMRKAFLKEHRTINYNRLLLTEKLYPHLREVEQAATSRLEQTMKALTERATLPDKAADPMGWTAAMNTLRAQAEEMVVHELIYS